MRLKLVLPTVLGHRLSPRLVRNFNGGVIRVRQIRDTTDPETGLPRRRTQNHPAIRPAGSRTGRSSSTLSTLSVLTIRINDPSVAVCRKCWSALTALLTSRRSRLAHRRGLAEGRHGCCDHQGRHKSKYPVSHNNPPAWNIVTCLVFTGAVLNVSTQDSIVCG